MSAVVTSLQDEDWYANSHTWSIILDRAVRDLEPAQREIFERHADPVGVMFSLIEPPERRDVARWLLRAVEALAGPEAGEHGWDDERNRAHLGGLATLLRSMT